MSKNKKPDGTVKAKAPTVDKGARQRARTDANKQRNRAKNSGGGALPGAAIDYKVPKKHHR